MDFKRILLSFLCVPLIFISTAFSTSHLEVTHPTGKTNKGKKRKKRFSNLVTTSPTSTNSSSNLSSSFSCFPVSLELTNFHLVVKDSTDKENTPLEADSKQEEQDNILALLDEEANQKTNENNIDLDVEEINMTDFSTPNNLSISPQLLEKVVIRERFINSVVDIAVAQEDVPYIHGGKSPKGFDCSGFVSYVYSQFEINLPASSSSYDYVGKKVQLENAQVGDVICFTGRNLHSGRTGHVGIIIENNPNEPIKFIHAASGSRRKVTYSTMESSYYKPRFRSVRRISTPSIKEILQEIESAE
ncbi:C40 family peptidase [Bernardetia sp. ABR2-2B]|uniref:C40 family peptidase n=1 Tax=Bernardetia sp. ABR2-2B TaxID=3127472 RepID=UPI0030D4A36A